MTEHEEVADSPSSALKNAEVIRRSRKRLEESGVNVSTEQILADLEAIEEERIEHLLSVLRESSQRATPNRNDGLTGA
jgi:hypothetical protein